MGKRTVSSRNQKGGITAFNVDVKTNGNISDNSDNKTRGLPLWVKWLVALCTIGAFVTGIIFLIRAITGGQ